MDGNSAEIVEQPFADIDARVGQTRTDQVCYKNEIYGKLARMADVVRLSPVPRIGDMFIDARGDDRTMRVSLHPDRDIAVVSLWAGTTCRATFQLPLNDGARLAELFNPPDTSAVDDTDPGHPYPGLAGAHDPGEIHTTGAMVRPNLPQAS